MKVTLSFWFVIWCVLLAGIGIGLILEHAGRNLMDEVHYFIQEKYYPDPCAPPKPIPVLMPTQPPIPRTLEEI